MKILVYGPSGTLGTGYGVAECERFPALLASQLEQHFPDRRIELNVQAWRFFSPMRRQSILDEIDDHRPDYLVLEATPNWVYFSTWISWARRHLPAAFQRHIGNLDRADSRLRQYLRPYPWLRRAYEFPAGLVGRRLARREPPLYTVPGVVDFFSSLVSVAKRHESMDLIVTNHRHLSAAHAHQFPEGVQLAEQLAAALKAECRRHHVRFVDYSEGLQSLPQPDLFLPDAVHLSVAAKRCEATMLARTIYEAERAFA